MRIGELAERCGVSVRSLRYYEEQGLLSSDRSPAGQRLYDESQVELVVFIKRMLAAGLSSRTILELRPCASHPGQETSQAAFVRLLEERARMTEHIHELERTRESLDDLILVNRAHNATLPKEPAQAPR